jgi:hypothetical protein
MLRAYPTLNGQQNILMDHTPVRRYQPGVPMNNL